MLSNLVTGSDGPLQRFVRFGLRAGIGLLIPAAIGLVSLSVDALAQTTDDADKQTLGVILSALNDRSRLMDGAGEASVRAGEAALAQEQYLMRDIVARTSEQLRFIHGEELNKKLGDLEPIERLHVDRFYNLAEAIGFDDPLSTLANAFKLHAAANELFQSIPAEEDKPLIYGMLSGDLAENPAARAADIEIFAHRAIDKVSKKMPALIVEGAEIPPDLISVQDDVILARFPESLQQRLHFGQMPCVPRDTFSVLITAYTSEPHGVWPFRSIVQGSVSSELHALPSARVFDLHLTDDFDRTLTSSTTQSFSQKSPYVLAECGQTVSSSVELDAPAGATEISCAASWVDTRAVRHATGSCHIDRESIKATGAITAFDKVCSEPTLCSCSEAGRGWLQIDGAYKLKKEETENVVAASLGDYTLPAETELTFPLRLEPDTRLKHIGFLIKRKSCPDAFDHLDMFFPNGSSDRVEAVSKSGSFRASYADGRMTVRHSSSESTVGDANPK